MQPTERTGKARSKTWKIGEECMGGIIRAKLKEESVLVEIIPWNGGSALARLAFGRIHLGGALENWLNEYTTSYHASNVVEWVKKGWNV